MTKTELRKKLSEEPVFQVNGVQIEVTNDLFRVSCNGRELSTDDFEIAFTRFLKEMENIGKTK